MLWGLSEGLIMSTHNVSVCAEIRKILSGTMHSYSVFPYTIFRKPSHSEVILMT